ncbi:hypothetical protein Nepgr_013067 [Nepenthes gracilis]|uniref:phosphoribosylglycinamide formyltransferase 1 n=1 Tax=Nepenthes gracilis TaxID=150966 RepID=A0AAD3SI86_NEPGR|nr:hypothetical protein Nepgr_013067 [Nepenthes gracilis]
MLHHHLQYPCSMDARNMLSRFSANITVPSVTNLKISIFTPSFVCFIQNNKCSSVKSNYSLSLCSGGNTFRKIVLRCEKNTSNADDFSVSLGDSQKLRKKSLAIFVSGGGSNFRAIHEATLDGSIQGDVVVLVTSKEGCGGAQYARDKGIPAVLFPSWGLSPNDIVTTLRRLKVDFILLAGYLKLIPIELVQAYPRCILNIHPSLLPAFGGKGYYGLKVHKAVIASGARYSGPTVHFVNENYDEGCILAQRVVPVMASDTADELAARVLHEEHHLYVEVVAALCEDRIIWRADGVPLIQSREDPNAYS